MHATRAILLFLFLAFWAGLSSAQNCTEDTADIRGPGGQSRFSIEIADDTEERNRGLMFRTELAASQGMLFIFDSPRKPAFWMKNTLIPLDMIFFTPDGVVQHVHSMAQPHDLSPITGGDNVAMLLEIRGGMANLLGIGEGYVLRHPRLDQSIAAWPCDSEN